MTAKHLTQQLQRLGIEGRVITTDSAWYLCTPHPFATQVQRIGESFTEACAQLGQQFGIVFATQQPALTDERQAWIRRRRADLKAHWETEGVEFDAILRILKGQVLPQQAQAAVDEYDALGAEDHARIGGD